VHLSINFFIVIKLKKQFLTFTGFLATALLLLYSCIEKELDFDGIKTQDWNSEWALPLINSELSLDDLLNDSIENIEEDENGLISLVYESQQLVSVKASEITSIPDQVKEISENFDLPPIPVGISGEVPIIFKFTFELDEPNLRLDSLLLKNGFYNFRFRTDLDKDITGVDFEIPNMKHVQNGSTLQFTLDIDPMAGQEIEKDTLFDLSEYKIVFENTFSDTNQIYINALVHFVSDGEPPNNPYFILLENFFNFCRNIV